MQFSQIKKRPQRVVLFDGADGGTRTRMSYARHPLKMVCMPVSPHPHAVLRLFYYSFCTVKSQAFFTLILL